MTLNASPSNNVHQLIFAGGNVEKVQE